MSKRTGTRLRVGRTWSVLAHFPPAGPRSRPAVCQAPVSWAGSVHEALSGPSPLARTLISRGRRLLEALVFRPEPKAHPGPVALFTSRWASPRCGGLGALSLRAGEGLRGWTRGPEADTASGLRLNPVQPSRCWSKAARGSGVAFLGRSRMASRESLPTAGAASDTLENARGGAPTLPAAFRPATEVSSGQEAAGTPASEGRSSICSL